VGRSDSHGFGELVENYVPSAYGEAHVDVYDALYADAFRTDLAVERLAGLAADHGGSVLDLGIGTGRLAQPLVQAGIEVHGIEASPAMIERLRKQPGTADISVWRADMADFSLPGRYGVIVSAVSTLFMLPDSQRQIDCLRCAADHLGPGGVVVIEGFVPDQSRYDRKGDRTELRRVGENSLHMVSSHHDPITQTVVITHVQAGADGVRSYAVTLRYAWPSELDLMARLAGLELVERFGGWDGRTFDAATTDHVSIYRLAGTWDSSRGRTP
jgi:SAM-dependent methyltransferase